MAQICDARRWTRFVGAMALAMSLGWGCSPLLLAQQGGDGLSVDLGGNIGASLYSSDQQQGLDSAFDPSTSNLSNPEVRTGISDPLHSQLLGSELSPMADSFANFSVDAQSTSGVDGKSGALSERRGAGRGQESQDFLVGSNAVEAGGMETRLQAMRSLGTESMRSAFSGGAAANQAFAGRDMSSPESQETGGPTASGMPEATLAAAEGAMGSPRAPRFTDPVLTGSSAGYEASDLELGTNMATPSSATAGFFAEPVVTREAHYEFDDGQTPGFSPGPEPGGVLGGGPQYFPPKNGFPDSTTGTAGLAPETSNWNSPFSSMSSITSSPFPPVSEGTVYGVHTGIAVDLHAPPLPEPRVSFAEYERQMQEQRIVHGATITQAAEAYQRDLRSYQKLGGPKNHSSLQELEQLNFHPELNMATVR